MPLEFAIEERRTLDGLASVVDDALSLADYWGWSYALAYLVSERVPPRVIQRLLSGSRRAKSARHKEVKISQEKGHGWNGRNSADMERLFEALRHRSVSESVPSPRSTSCSKPRSDENN